MKRSTSEETVEKPRRERAGGAAVVVIVLVLALLGGGAYAAAYAYAGDGLPRDTRIADVDLGGLERDAAVDALRTGLADRLARPIAVRADGRTTELTAADLGLGVDLEASVEAAVRARSWRPQDLWDHYTAPVHPDPVFTVDDATYRAAIADLTADRSQQPVDATLTFTRRGVETTPAQQGRAVDPDAALPLLQEVLLTNDPGPVELEVGTVSPDIDDADVQAALTEFANPAMSSSVVLRFGRTPVRLQPSQFAPALAMKAEGGRLVPDVDAARIARLVADATGGDGAPVDATVALVGGRPSVVPAKPGVDYDPDDVAATFTGLLTKPEGEREAQVSATASEPEVTTAEARSWRIKEKVSTFTTYFPYAEYRNTNIGRAAQIIDGTVLKPGETFSLNDTVGERTRENGFTDGFIISNGIFKEDLGGGVSQMATTLFNAMFFAGLEDVEHKPHSLYIDRYPVGREATVAWGSVDLRFRNDTPYGILIDTAFSPSTPSSQGAVTVTMYSTKIWDITTSTSARYDITKPKTRTLSTADCYPNTGYDGFSVDVYRYFRKTGSRTLERTEKFHTVYIPSDTVICKPPGR
ncbi:VanW family protein [Nocardioides fonticola]|uniref:VanW family protein n=1 Tax=Nocardioides fonticola TaxID=450363 RepID=A0ABP7Y3R5_9ACTN